MEDLQKIPNGIIKAQQLLSDLLDSKKKTLNILQNWPQLNTLQWVEFDKYKQFIDNLDNKLVKVLDINNGIILYKNRNDILSFTRCMDQNWTKKFFRMGEMTIISKNGSSTQNYMYSELKLNDDGTLSAKATPDDTEDMNNMSNKEASTKNPFEKIADENWVIKNQEVIIRYKSNWEFEFVK